MSALEGFLVGIASEAAREAIKQVIANTKAGKTAAEQLRLAKSALAGQLIEKGSIELARKLINKKKRR